MFEVVRYEPKYKQAWDDFVQTSKNGIFLFLRDYMDYHSDRYNDCSFLIFRKGKLGSVIPGNISDETYYSHQGLSFGGLIISNKIGTNDVLHMFDLLNNELFNYGFKKVCYKPIPYIYHKLPAQEDIYSLFRLNAKRIVCNISTTIYQNNKLKFIESRKSGIRKSLKNGIKIEESDQLDLFWPILNDHLKNKYGKSAVHTLEEISYLKSLFPNNIKLYVAIKDDVVAGTVVYLMDRVAHIQYIAASEYGRSIGATDLLFQELINKEYTDVPIFDFGHSNEKMGHWLNEGLIFQKEGFGGRGVVYEIYEYNTEVKILSR